MQKFKIKIDPAKALSWGVTGLGIVLTLLSNKVDDNNRKALKDELKADLLKELSSDKN